MSFILSFKLSMLKFKLGLVRLFTVYEMKMPRNIFLLIFQSFMASRDMLHQLSCSQIPQTKWHHWKKISLDHWNNSHLFIACQCSFIILGRCGSYSCLINRMPSSVLHGQVSHSILLPKEPLYVVPPRVFGSMCFVHDLSGFG